MFDDIDRIMHVMGTAFDPIWGEAWNRRQVTDSLVMPSIHYLIADETGNHPSEKTQAAAFALIRAAPGEEELLLIGVDPQHRSKGLARGLLQSFASNARGRGAERLFLEMRANNPAEKLYRAFGFEPIGRRKEYYRAAEGKRIDAITFGMKLETLV